mmetsp:Transcript_17615/g.42878  ORF Transcript_17615/g.42878 Transcript_17615/m.42878 type:complete len:352 (+) Transcript_17615:168-1223(+)
MKSVFVLLIKIETRTSRFQTPCHRTNSNSNKNKSNEKQHRISRADMTTTTSNDILQAENDLRNGDNDLLEESKPTTDNNPPTSSDDSVKVAAVCPFSGQTMESTTSSTSNQPSSHATYYQYIPLRMGGRGGTHLPSEGSRKLFDNGEVTLDDLERMTSTFYDLAFQDKTIDKFIRSHDDPHGPRFAKWIHQKLTGSQVWDIDRQSRDLTPHEVAGGRTAVVHDRSSAHAAAWYSPKRPPSEVGRHFKLDECRVWMRLHFWAMRLSGIVEQSPSMADYYVRFIGHFVSVYEGSATKFARESFRWSNNTNNISKYLEDGRQMNDILGVNFWEAAKDLTEDELEDDDWPYYVEQ